VWTGILFNTPRIVGETHDRDGLEVESPEKLFLIQLETIERAIHFACRRGSLRDEDAEDFASYVKVKLIEKDYAVIRKYERRSSFAAFMSVVVQRMLLDYRIGQWGKWHASAEARRMGEPAITIEAILYRDGRTIDEMMPVLIRRWPELARAEVESVVRRLPSRTPRLRAVDLDSAGDTLAFLGACDDDPTFASERSALARRVAIIVRSTLRDLEEHDRLIFRLRFEGGLSVADVSRVLRIEQKPLYRRLQRALMRLRKRLEAAGVSAADAEELLTSRSIDLDFGFDSGAPLPPSTDEEEA
jgi:RNA polymerase sigma factor (sigma-70 family)